MNRTELFQRKKSKEPKMTSLAIKEMQIKRFHLTPHRRAIIKNTTINVGEDVGEKQYPHTLFVGM
jgi:hypothetical protein